MSIKAVVMAGGFGTRMQPLTVNLPKPMLRVGNRPILEHVISLLSRYGIKEQAFLLYYYPDIIKDYFKDGSDFGVEISYFTPTRDFGTAGAVKYAEDFLDDTFVVISGDVITNFNIEEAIHFHKERKAIATIVLTQVDDPLQFGIVILDEDKRVIRFLEKPGWDEVFSNTVNTGIYVLEPKILEYIPASEPFDFSKNLFPMLLGEGRPLYGYPASGYWYDVGNPDVYLRVNIGALAGEINIPFPGNALRFGDSVVFVEEGVKIGSGVAFLGNVVIGKNSEIMDHSYIRNAVIGEDCVIGKGVIIGDSVIWNNVRIGDYTHADGCVICNGVEIGDGAVLRRYVVLGDGVKVGEGAYVREGTKVWPNRIIEKRAVLSDNLVWMERWKKSIFASSRVRGITNVELTSELSAKLGVAYGSSLLIGNSIATGRDSHKASRVLKRSFIGGVASTGVHTVDFHGLPIPVFRYNLSSGNFSGGVYFKQVIDDPLSTEIYFLDKNGIDISASMEKGIERIFFREDFRRAPYSVPGAITPLNDVISSYQEKLLKSIDTEKVRNRYFRILVDYRHGTVSPVLAPLLRKLQCDVVSIDAYPEDENLINPDSQAKKELQFSSIARSLELDVGFSLGIWGEEISLIDRDGFVYKDMDMLLLMLFLVSKVFEHSIFTVPAMTPSVAEEIVGDSNMIRRVKHTSRSILLSAFDEGVVFCGDNHGRFIFSEFQKAFDAIYVVLKIMEIIANKDVEFEELKEKIAKVNLLHATVPCEWQEKGNVMSTASEKLLKYDRVSLIDGIKVRFGDNWVLLLPDDNKPIFHIYVEAKTAEDAKALLEEYKEKVSEWRGR